MSRGVWRRAEAPPTAHESLLAVTLRAPHATVCLLSALAFHGLVDVIPTVVDLAVARGRHRPAIDYPPVQVHVFDADTFELGRQQVEVAPDETVPVYDPVRSVVDAVRLRTQVGTDLAYGAARHLLGRRRSAAGELAAMSQALRCAGPVHELLVQQVCAVEADDGVTIQLASMDVRTIREARATKASVGGCLPP